MLPYLDPLSILVIVLGLVLGGVLKGATGAGSPVIAVPVMAAFFDPRLAVVIMVVPNLVSNLIQLRQYGSERLAGGFAWSYALAGGAGAGVGTFLLAAMPERALSLIVAVAVVGYVSLRLARPDFRLDLPLARRLVWPAGVVAGVLQGAAGISAPVSVSFLNAMRLERPVFIATISIFFTVMSIVQIPAMLALGLLNWPLAALSVAALLPLTGGMPLGAWLARRMSAKSFDRVILVFLVLLALRLIHTALW